MGGEEDAARGDEKEGRGAASVRPPTRVLSVAVRAPGDGASVKMSRKNRRRKRPNGNKLIGPATTVAASQVGEGDAEGKRQEERIDLSLLVVRRAVVELAILNLLDLSSQLSVPEEMSGGGWVSDLGRNLFSFLAGTPAAAGATAAAAAPPTAAADPPPVQKRPADRGKRRSKVANGDPEGSKCKNVKRVHPTTPAPSGKKSEGDRVQHGPRQRQRPAGSNASRQKEADATKVIRKKQQEAIVAKNSAVAVDDEDDDDDKEGDVAESGSDDPSAANKAEGENSQTTGKTRLPDRCPGQHEAANEKEEEEEEEEEEKDKLCGSGDGGDQLVSRVSHGAAAASSSPPFLAEGGGQQVGCADEPDVFPHETEVDGGDALDEDAPGDTGKQENGEEEEPKEEIKSSSSPAADDELPHFPSGAGGDDENSPRGSPTAAATTTMVENSFCGGGGEKEEEEEEEGGGGLPCDTDRCGSTPLLEEEEERKEGRKAREVEEVPVGSSEGKEEEEKVESEQSSTSTHSLCAALQPQADDDVEEQRCPPQSSGNDHEGDNKISIMTVSRSETAGGGGGGGGEGRGDDKARCRLAHTTPTPTTTPPPPPRL